jgi:predicted nuclease of restriction endonuclease-like (RecB) superfamily
MLEMCSIIYFSSETQKIKTLYYSAIILVQIFQTNPSILKRFNLTIAGCLAHARRMFKKHESQDPLLSGNKSEIKKLAKQGHVIEKASDVIKNPLVLEFLELEEKAAYSESDLESAIIDKLETFLLELGKGFLFEARQKRFSFENDHFFVDLVFYNRLLRCYVIIDLKRGKLTHQDLGQMQMYVNYFDRHVKLVDELPTIGIVLCHRKNDALVELTLPKDANIFATKYQLYLPSKEELKAQLEKIEAELKVQK